MNICKTDDAPNGAKRSYIKDRTVYRGRPETGARLPKEERVYELLDSLGIEYLRLDHEPIATVDGCSEVDALLGITICKNLFLCDRKKEHFYLLMMPGKKRFDTKIFSAAAQSSRLSFAPEAYMERFLDITPGSVSVLGLMNDKDRRVKLYIDSDVLAEEYIGCHPCINTSSLKIKTEDIIKGFLPAVEHEFETVKLPWQEGLTR